MTLTLALRDDLALSGGMISRVDLSSLIPEQLQALTTKAIADLPLQINKDNCQVGDLFTISGQPGAQLIFDGLQQNKHLRLDGIGAEMQHGEIEVHGSAGAFVGRAMKGGRIHVNGNSGAFSGSAMSGGYLQIDGDAGDFTAGVRSGERVGMNGGLIVIKGNSGDRIGDRQRRGIIIVEGSVGDYCGSDMIAGSIAVGGQTGKQPGLGMRRGTLILMQTPDSLPTTFNDNGIHQLNFLNLFMRRFAGHFPAWKQKTQVQRWVGDIACAGLGEILIARGV